MVALSESVMKIRLKRPLAEKSRWRHIRPAIKPRYLGSHASQITKYYGTLSGSHGRFFRIRHENRVKRTLAAKSRWRHIRLSIKPRYLGNHASKIKSYYGTLSVSHDRTLRIRHEKSREAPLASKSRWRLIRLAIKARYLGNHASQIKSYYWSLSGTNGRSFRIHHKKSPEAPPGGEIMMTSHPAGNKISLYRKPCIPDKKLLWNTMRKSWSLFQNPSWKIAWSAPWRWNHEIILLAIKAHNLGNHASQIKSYYGSLSGSLGRLLIFIKKSANINSKSLSVYKCC